MSLVHHPIRKRALAAATAVFAILMSSQGTAHAAGASASSCLQGLSGSGAVVNSYGGKTLKCGNRNQGVIHINVKHPISKWGADDVDIEECMNNILARGSDTAAGPGNDAKKWLTPTGYAAVIVWREDTKEVVTMYIQGTQYGNEWDRCD